MLQYEALRAVGIAASLENRVVGVRIEWPRHHDFAVLFFRRDERGGRPALLDPIHDH